MLKLKDLLMETKTFRRQLSELTSVYGGESKAIDMLNTGKGLKSYKLDWSPERLEQVLSDMGGEEEFLSRVAKLASIKPPAGAPKRIDMPVINSDQVEQVQQAITKGEYDVFTPYKEDGDGTSTSKGKFDKDQFSDSGADSEFMNDKDFLTKGVEDDESGGNADIVRSKKTEILATMLKPSQSAIYLEKAIGGMFGQVGDEARKGVVSGMNPNDIIVVKGNYILDGHHRWASAMLANPKAKLEVTFIDLPIEVAIPVLRTVGNALGNKGQK
tara:strand:- start:371 stop:1183 length:813 start_codon:yes stop_codon:yes gene_type:complete